MLQFEGDRDFTLAPADLWAKLTDARFLVQCIPDVDSEDVASRSGPRGSRSQSEFRLRPRHARHDSANHRRRRSQLGARAGSQ